MELPGAHLNGIEVITRPLSTPSLATCYGGAIGSLRVRAVSEGGRSDEIWGRYWHCCRADRDSVGSGGRVSEWHDLGCPENFHAEHDWRRSIRCNLMSFFHELYGRRSGAGVCGERVCREMEQPRWQRCLLSEPVGTATSGLQGVSCTSPAACTAVGYYFVGLGSEFTLAERWNGTAWWIDSSPSPGSYGPTLLGVSCPSASDCTAVGTYQAVTGGPNVTLAEQWNGVQWTVQSTPNPTAAGHWTQLTNVSCSASSACTAVGYYLDASNAEVMLAERWDGHVWAIQSIPTPAGAPQTLLSGVSCQSAAACTAVGKQVSTTQTLTLAERWNGTMWQLSRPRAALQVSSPVCPVGHLVHAPRWACIRLSAANGSL